jgi:hypothetical protein
MSEYNPDRLYQLIPAIYRIRDAENGYPLMALLRLLQREAGVVEDDLWQMYADWFVETSADWALPYIGDLVGFRPAPEAGDPTNLDVSDPTGRARALTPRRDIANAVRSRRRKGTLALLEEIARDAAGWPGRVVEFFRLLTVTQNLNYPRPGLGGTVSLRSGRNLDRLSSAAAAFDQIAHTADLRAPGWTPPVGRGSLPGVGLFIWRLRAYSVTRSRAEQLEEVGPYAHTFSVLGNNTQLYTKPQPEPDSNHIAGPLNLPVPITRREFEDRSPAEQAQADPNTRQPVYSMASADYYGLDKSLAVWAPDWPVRGAPQPIPREMVIPANLKDWTYRTPRDHISIDPELGRIAFPLGQLPKAGVSVSYYYGFAAAIGGGEYDRPLLESAPGAGGDVLLRVGRDRPGADDTITAAYNRWRAMDPRPRSAVIEIIDSGVYTEPLDVTLDENESLQIRAANHARPVIRLLDYVVDRPDPFRISGAAGSRLTLDGLLITGRGVAVFAPEPVIESAPRAAASREPDQRSGGKRRRKDRDYAEEEPADAETTGAAQPPTRDLCAITIRHCTLVPGWGLDNDCDPLRPAEPSLELHDTGAHVRIQHSILGAIRVYADRAARDPLRIDISDSILDSAGGHDCDHPECEAIGAPDGLAAFAILDMRRCTVFGRVFVDAIALAENSIFTGLLRVARKQTGCLRFCSVVPGSRTPPRYECQPDKAITALGLAASDPDRQHQEAMEALRVRPQFMSTRYSTPNYARLSDDGPLEIARGADDESAMGAFHDLYEPQRTALLELRLQEFTPAGMDGVLIYAT